jgi:exosortase C (VPDSG-CTERM-specific)
LLGGVCLAFCQPLASLAAFAREQDIYSHILLIPFISGYLVWTDRATYDGKSAPNRLLAGWLVGVGLATIGLYWGLRAVGQQLGQATSLALSTGSFLCFLWGVSCWVVGRNAMRSLAFPLGFLIFMVPLPELVLNGIEAFLQSGSAWCAEVFISLLGTPLYRQDLVLQLPGINLQVAPECSGIHSSYALLITSVLAGRFFLRSALSRTVLALAVVPLALVRNGFRIFTIGELCVHISPDMINSWIHHHGGPVFFALSLVPFFGLLLGLIKWERRRLGPARVPATV